MKKSSAPKTILVVRNDKLGDFMLAWPSFAAIKTTCPDSRVIALVPSYTRDMAELCPWIDEVLIDPGSDSGISGFWQLLKAIRAYRFDLMVTLFSTTRIALAGLLAGIPSRWAPATKAAQFFYNNRLKQKRSKSEKPEYQYNVDLALASLCNYPLSQTTSLITAPYLNLDQALLQETRKNFYDQQQIATDKKLAFIHSGHGGSANNLSIEQYARLSALINRDDLCFVLTAGPGELQATQELEALLKAASIDCRIYHSEQGLKAFTLHLALADLFIAGSTGTLHIAGALDRPTVGFYPNRRSATPLRWRTLNSEGRYLAVTPPDEVEQDMSQVDLTAAAARIQQFMQQLWS